MKVCQYFFIFLILYFPLQATEEISTKANSTFVADQKSTQKHPPSSKEDSTTKPILENDKKIQTTDKKPEMDDNHPSNMKKVTESYETAFIKTIVVLIGLLVLISLTVWMFRKLSHGRLRSFNYMKSVKILEKRPLSPKSMLYLIEVGGKQVLIAESQLHVKQVASLEWLSNEKDL